MTPQLLGQTRCNENSDHKAEDNRHRRLSAADSSSVLGTLPEVIAIAATSADNSTDHEFHIAPILRLLMSAAQKSHSSCSAVIGPEAPNPADRLLGSLSISFVHPSRKPGQ